MDTYVRHAFPRRIFAGVVDGLRNVGDLIVGHSDAMRCKAEAERLFQLSDVELAKFGLTRDRIVQHAFARYLTH